MIKYFLSKFSNEENLVSIKTFNNTITYKELFRKSKIISNSLSFLLIQTDEYVPILISNSDSFIEVVLALWNLGKTPVPINLRWTSDEIGEVINFFNFKYILYEHKFFDQIKTLNAEAIDFERHLEESDSDNKQANNLKGNALVIFTSGSSERPKAVVHSFDSLFNSVFNSHEILNLQPKDKILASLPFYHIGGFQLITRALLNGCEIIIPENQNSESIDEAIKIFQPTHLSLVSTQLRRMIEAGIEINYNIKSTFVGGGFIDDELILKANKMGWKPLRVYGSSETASFVCAGNPEEIKIKSNTVGKPVKNTTIKISDENEILISSNSLFKGYLSQDQNIKSGLIDNFYHSGDLGYLDNEGYLFIEPKRTDLIISGGENVNPYEIENYILQIDGVQEVCVFPINDEEWGQIVAAAIVTNKNLNEKEIIEFLSDKIAGYKIPKAFYFTDHLPKISIGKLDRKKIISFYNSNNEIY